MLLLGSSAHVHLTPHAVYALPEEGLSRPNASILLLSSQGTEPTLCRADRLTKFERAKLYLSAWVLGVYVEPDELEELIASGRAFADPNRNVV